MLIKRVLFVGAFLFTISAVIHVFTDEADEVVPWRAALRLTLALIAVTVAALLPTGEEEE